MLVTNCRIIGGSKIPPGNVSDFTAVGGDGTVTLTWQDPADYTPNWLTEPISVWAGTRIVRKEGGYPADERDGVVVVDSTVRNQYATNGYVDSGLTNDVTYYYQAFPRSDKGAVNRNTANRVSVTPTFVILNDMTWAQIAEAAQSGLLASRYAVGAEKNITRSTGEVLTLQIAGYNHDDLTSGGKAKVTFIMKHLMSSTSAISGHETYLNSTVLTSLPSELRAVIKPVNKQIATSYTNPTLIAPSRNLFLLSETEVFGARTYSAATEGAKYAIFTDATSRIKKMSNGTGAAAMWSLRSPGYSSNNYYCAVRENGTNGYTSNDTPNARGVCFGLCV